ncbi:response regulator [Luteimonas sp. R10]|uniref:response regulator n=1 Tax=Luteimonas sp. R10 TaxID=3108176 RepID=UPI00308B5B24|nr:response regulator [Luteimonas sp. R10]
MSTLVEWTKTRLTGRPDSEHGQAMVRLTIASLILLYLAVLRTVEGATQVNTMIAVMAAESVVALLIMAAILKNPGRSDLRRVFGMITDYTTLAMLMSLNAPALSPLYVIIMWVTIGNGLRFGTRYLYAASALAAVAFLVVIVINPFWRNQPYLAGGLWVGLVAIPGYLSSLLTSLHRATEEAKRANEAKSRFLASMSHEFRSPLNGIIGMSELMRSSKLSTEQREYSDVIHASAQSLLLMVEDVLDISAIESGKLKRKDADFDLREVIRRLAQMMQPQAEAKGLKLSVSIDPDVPTSLYGDGAYLTQILVNLSHNAVKFTEHGSVSVSVHLLGRATGGDQARLRFSVRDTGIGVPDDHKQRIFGAFEQVDSGPTRRFGGTGLGTTIAKTFAQLLQGEIGLEDNPGGGSHFWVDIPFAEGARSPRNDSNIVAFDDPFVRHKARVSSLRVLIADDQYANRAVLTRILERAGHKVQSANDGELALDILESGNVDLAVIDMHMPNLSGIDVIRQLRFMQAGSKRTPIIVLSADATLEAARQATEAGAQAFLTKPVMVTKLLETIAGLQGDPRKLQGMRFAEENLRAVTNPDVLEELAAMGLGDGFLAKFVGQCIRDADECMNQLKTSAADRNWEAFRDAAHALKGVSENLGAKALAERCQQVMGATSGSLSREHARIVSEMSTQFASVAEQSRREVTRLSGQQVSPNSGRDTLE